MSTAVLRYVFKPNPGADLPALIGLIKEAAGMWREHGAEVSLWSVQVGEIGNMAFTARFESSAKLGATLDAINVTRPLVPGVRKTLKRGWPAGSAVIRPMKSRSERPI